MREYAQQKEMPGWLRTQRKAGTTLIELLGVMAVLAIIAGLAIGGVMHAQEQARKTSAETAITAYRDAFISACNAHPGLVGDRAAAWGDSESNYSTEKGLQKLAGYMNEYLDGSLSLAWDPTGKYYKSVGLDPWGGNYILTEYPKIPGGLNYYDPTVGGNEGIMAASIWATGNNDSLLTQQKVTKDSYGALLLFKDGLAECLMPGFEKLDQFIDSTISFK